MGISRERTPGFDDYGAAMDLMRQIDALTWAYIADAGKDVSLRIQRTRRYAAALKKSISAYIDARTEMLCRLITDSDFTAVFPAPISEEPEANQSDRFLSLYSKLFEALADEAPPMPDGQQG